MVQLIKDLIFFWGSFQKFTKIQSQNWTYYISTGIFCTCLLMEDMGNNAKLLCIFLIWYFHVVMYNTSFPPEPSNCDLFKPRKFCGTQSFPIVILWTWLHPGRLTWNIQITHLERKMIFQTSMMMFHVNLPGCIPKNPRGGLGQAYLVTSNQTECVQLVPLVPLMFFGKGIFHRWKRAAKLWSGIHVVCYMGVSLNGGIPKTSQNDHF